MYGQTHVNLKIISVLCQHKKKYEKISPNAKFPKFLLFIFYLFQVFKSQSWIGEYLNSTLWWNIENFKHVRKENIWNKKSLLNVQVVCISLFNVKTTSKMSCLCKRDFGWGILFAKLNNGNSSTSKANLKKGQTFCLPSDWWHSPFSVFFLRV